MIHSEHIHISEKPVLDPSRDYSERSYTIMKNLDKKPQGIAVYKSLLRSNYRVLTVLSKLIFYYQSEDTPDADKK